jgi:hypothetical protein
LIKHIVGFICYIAIFGILNSLGIDYHNWQFYALLVVLIVIELNEHYSTQKKTIENCLKIIKGER